MSDQESGARRMPTKSPVEKSAKTVKILEKYQARRERKATIDEGSKRPSGKEKWSQVITNKMNLDKRVTQQLLRVIQEATEKERAKHNDDSWLERFLDYVKSHKWLQTLIFILAVAMYSCIGAGIFYAIEHPEEERVLKEREDKITAQATENVKWVFNTINSGCLFANGSSYNANTSTDSECFRYILEKAKKKTHEDYLSIVGKEPYRWGFWSGLYYCMSIYTTIGYGNIAPKTLAGRLVTIFYALIGIPLFLVVISDIGESILKGFQYLYRRVSRYINNLRNAVVLPVQAEVEANPLEEFHWGAAFLIFFTYMFGYAGLLLLWESWDYWESLYFTFVSLSTIGFGDVVPSDPKGAASSFVLTVVGLALLSMSVTIFQEELEEKYMDALELLEDLADDSDDEGEPSSSGSTPATVVEAFSVREKSSKDNRN